MTTRTPCWVATIGLCPCCGGQHTVWSERPFRWVPHAYECPEKRERCVIAGSALVGRQTERLPEGALQTHEEPSHAAEQ